MTTENMNVHKALAELKTLDARIEKAIYEANFAIANKHSNKQIGGNSITAYSESAKSAYQKIDDLINRRNAIKKAVVLSNARTIVNIGGTEYTVAEAIEMKNHGISHLQRLFTKVSGDYHKAQVEADRNNGERLEMRADEHIKNLFDGKVDVKNLSEEAMKARKDFIEAQTYEIIDPLKAREKMEELEKKINGFMVDIDSALSTSNALTDIEVSY